MIELALFWARYLTCVKYGEIFHVQYSVAVNNVVACMTLDTCSTLKGFYYTLVVVVTKLLSGCCIAS